MKKIIFATFLFVSQIGFAQETVPVIAPNVVFTAVEEMPQFPGGDSAMYAFISENITYPESLKEKGMSGKVYIQFVVEEDGQITNIKVLRSPHELFTKEAESMMAKMPKWIPGVQRGKPVRVRLVLPIDFKA